MKNLYNSFSELFLFNGVDSQTLIDISEKINPQKLTFSAKEIIYSPEQFDKKIGFVLKGACVVERLNHQSKSIPLNKLKVTDSFGVIAIFGKGEKYPTRIKSLTKSEILFLTQKDVYYLIDNHPAIAKNIIEYLSEKIKFLNEKIATFTSDNVEQKLASYILSESSKSNDDFITFNCKKSAEALNIGRASLYRAISSLTESGCIKLENKKIYINDREGLERILK